MSDKGIDWSGAISDIGAIYPFQGSEMALFFLAVVLWVGWHVMVFRQESREIRDVSKDFASEHDGPRTLHR